MSEKTNQPPSLSEKQEWEEINNPRRSKSITTTIHSPVKIKSTSFTTATTTTTVYNSPRRSTLSGNPRRFSTPVMDENRERTPLLASKNDPIEIIEGKRSISSLTFIGLLFSTILIGCTNRVTFKIMQYSTMNYSYFDSQFTTLMYIPVNFAVIWYKMRYTNHITAQQRSFPKYKFAIMGLLDSLSGLLVMVAGLYVPGTMQSILLQGVVPVTMACSLLFLRPRGCTCCVQAERYLSRRKISYDHISILPKNCDEFNCNCIISVNNDTIKVTKKEHLDILNTLIPENHPNPANYQVILYTSARTWRQHLSKFYTFSQYIGALVILGGLVVSVWPALVGSAGSAGPVLWDVMFFLTTVPTAISAVYKEIVFRSVADMDVWYLNGYVALFQFFFGLPYAPLAAVMTNLKVADIPQNLYQGLLCFLLGTNFVTQDPLAPLANATCSVAANCGQLIKCCDSCDGSIPSVSAVSAFWGMALYLLANLSYNILMVLVIKHGSAALMYVASTVVLPMGAVCFTFPLLLGVHAKQFTVYDGSGLVVVLLGLIIYRFLGEIQSKEKLIPGVSTAINILEPSFVRSQPILVEDQFKPRTAQRIRHDFYHKLGVASPSYSTINS
eukprot:Sdes_comp10247_c0_seq1m1873